MPGNEGRAQSYTCPTCTADMTFDAESQMLRCAHCETEVPIAQQEGQRAIVEYDLNQGLAQATERGLGAPVRTVKCQECSATVSFQENVTSTACEFCGSNQVLPQESNRNLIRPESVVPFKVDGKTAAERFRGWLGSLWFRPSDLQKQARVAEMSGVYIPYWTFDSNVDSSWTAQAGHYYYETEYYQEQDQNGNWVQRTRQVQKTRWEPAWGSRHDLYDDLLVSASQGVPPDLALKLSTFDTAALQPYNPAFLSGWKAEEYAVDINDAWRQAVERIERSQYDHCAGDIPGDTYRNLNVTNRFHDERFKHVLLPLWISAFRYGGKPYRFLVNGQTGEVVGKAPWSIVKIVLFVLFLLFVLVVIISIFGAMSYMSDRSNRNGRYSEVEPAGQVAIDDQGRAPSAEAYQPDDAGLELSIASGDDWRLDHPLGFDWPVTTSSFADRGDRAASAGPPAF